MQTSDLGDNAVTAELMQVNNETDYLSRLKPLSLFTIHDGEWTQVEMPIETRRLRIGADAERCDFILDHEDADDIHIVIQRIGSSWYIIERGEKSLMLVNGFPRRQIHLKEEHTAVLQAGGLKFVFSTHQLENLNDEEEPGPLQDSQYGLSHCDISMNFNLDRNCLIGADPLCDFHLPGNVFVAMISNLGKRLFITSLSDEVVVEADGNLTEEHIPLVNGSSIRIGNETIKFTLSKDLSFSQNFNFVPDGKDVCMRFLQIDENGDAGDSYVLPPTGRSITIGRNSSECLIGISNSSQISRVHAQGLMYDKTLILIDNSTTNGTFVNNKRIKKRKCFPGDIIRFGDVKFILCFVG